MKISLLITFTYLICSVSHLFAQGDSTYVYDHEKYGRLIGVPHITPDGDVIQLASKKIGEGLRFDNHLLIRDSLGYFKKLLRLDLPETARLIRFIGQQKDKFYVVGEYKVPDSCCDKIQFVALVNRKGKIFWMTEIDIPRLSPMYTKYGLTKENDLLLVVPIVPKGYARKDFKRWEMLKIDLKGNLIWQKTISDSYDHKPENIITLDDKIYLGIVKENDRGTLPIEGYIYKFDNEGEILKIDTLAEQIEWSGEIVLHTHPNGFFAHFARDGRVSTLVFFNSAGEKTRKLDFPEMIKPMVVEDKLYGFRRNYRFQITDDNQLIDFAITKWKQGYPGFYKNGRYYSTLDFGNLIVYGKNGKITYGKSTYQDPPKTYNDPDYSSIKNFELPRILNDDNVSKIDQLFLVDMNGDQKKDLVLVNGSDFIQWYAGSGDGTFLPKAKFVKESKQLLERVERDAYKSVAIGDVNQDGLADIVFTLYDIDHTAEILWYENLGNERFSEQRPLVNAIEVRDLYVVDLDGDGKNDVINTSELLDGMFYHETQHEQMQGKKFISQKINFNVYFIDMDHDGDLDIFTFSKYGDKQVGYYKNPGSLTQEWDFVDWGNFGKQSTAIGAFRSSDSNDTLTIPKRDKAILIGSDTLMRLYDYASFIKLYDFNGDGQKDVFAVEPDRGPVIGINNNGTIGATILYECGGNSHQGKEFNVNLDQDADYELIYYRYNQKFVVGLDRTTNTRTIAAPQYFSLKNGFVHDLNQDGLEDLIINNTTQYIEGEAIAFLQQKDGIDTEQTLILQDDLPPGGQTLFVGNLTATSKSTTDVLTYGDNTQELVWYQYSMKGDEFVRKMVDSVHFNNAIANARIIDLNKDGQLHLFLQEERNRRTAYRLVIQENGFSTPQLIQGLPKDYYFQIKPTPSGLDSANIVGLNYSSSRSSVVSYFLTDEGELTNRTELGSIKAGIKHFWLHDLDRNGHTDILLPGEKKFYWLQNSERGFAAQSLSMRTYHPSLMHDFDNDGDLDFFDFQRTSYGYRENLDGKGLFAERQILCQLHDAEFGQYHYLFDVNNDGKKDIVVGLQGGGIVYSLAR